MTRILASDEFQKKKPKVLIVDDEPLLRETIAEILSGSFDPLLASNGLEAMTAVNDQQPEILLLDIMMPGIDGLQVCAKVRENPLTAHLPILMLTAANTTDHRLKAYGLGADDFIAKPFGIEELLVRVESKYRRSQQMRNPQLAENANRIQIQDIVLNPDTLEAKVGNDRLELSTFEFGLLKLFVNRYNTIVTRPQILEMVWGDTSVPTRLIDAHIVSLRKNLKKSRLGLKTIYGLGYILKDRDLTESSDEALPSADAVNL